MTRKSVFLSAFFMNNILEKVKHIGKENKK